MKIDRTNPVELLTITVPQEVKPGDMIRSCQEGLINLYSKKMGQVRLFIITKKERVKLYNWRYRQALLGLEKLYSFRVDSILKLLGMSIIAL